MIGDIVKVSVLMYNGNTQFINTFHYRDDGPVNLTIDTQLFAADFLTAWAVPWQAASLEPTFIYQCNVQVIAGPGAGDVAQFVPNPLIGGAVAETGIDSMLAISIKRSNGLKGPKNRGRIFFGPVGHHFIIDPVEGTVQINDADLNALCTFMTTPFVSGTSTLEPVLVTSPATAQPNGITRSSYGLNLIRRLSRKLRFPN